jgi:hypothetical protein|uniref:Uncharacterized protein n=1 Tax=Picea glauca TaxID=3330 RepID=A0A101LZL7_PICGL|nr:hypothetical protein ABT39_MTgene5265 [Picea glauca]QHR88807.1 hypothetical protein Q903MT_gene2823 [Picea sitchensis]
MPMVFHLGGKQALLLSPLMGFNLHLDQLRLELDLEAM